MPYPPSPRPPYPPPTAPRAATPGGRTNRTPLAALILGVVGPPSVWLGGTLGGTFGFPLFSAGGVVSVIALALGLTTQSHIRRAGGLQRDFGMAIAGIVLGAVGMLLGAYFVLHAVQCVQLWEGDPRPECLSHSASGAATPDVPSSTTSDTPIVQQTAQAPANAVTPVPAVVTPAPQMTTFPTVVDAALRYASSRSKAPTVGPAQLLGATPGASLTPFVFTSQNEIYVTLQYGGDGKAVPTSTTPSGPGVYGSFSTLLFSSHTAAVNTLSSETGPLMNTSSIPLGAGTATLGSDRLVPGSSAVTWSQGSWTFSVEGPDPNTDVTTGQQMSSYFGSHPLPAGPGVYAVTIGNSGESSNATWVQDAAQINVGAWNTDPTMTAQLALMMRTWPSGNS